MGAEQSVAGESQNRDGSQTAKTHIGNFMEEEVKKWEEVRNSSRTKDEAACACDESAPKMSRPYLDEHVRSWEEMHTNVA